MLILSGQNARKKFIHHPLAFPTNVQKNLHQHNGTMQIFLNISRDFSLFYNLLTFFIIFGRGKHLVPSRHRWPLQYAFHRMLTYLVRCEVDSQ